MGMRDVMAHHYFEIDVNVVFRALRVNVPPLLAAIREIKGSIYSI
ncbi:hypothetical protein Barb6_00080 [Bacteroidales bacterium Barb6]|nr:hypothetical protein Barb6_00080 [Bacteroidales bacterium Barb6]